MADPVDRAPNAHRLLVRVCGAITAATGVTALVGWSLALPLLTSFGSNYIPVAPSTAVLFAMYGVAVFLRADHPQAREPFWTGVVLSVAGAGVAGVLLVSFFLGRLSDAEHLGFSITGTIGQAPIGYMSPITAVCFLLASVSFLASLPLPGRAPWKTRLAFWSAGLLLAVGTVLSLSYLFGTPLLYAGSIVPPAAPTSVACAVLGIGLLRLAAPRGWAPVAPTEPATRGWHLLVAVFVLLSIGIVGIGYLYFRGQAQQIRTNVERQLSAIAALKVDELVHYRQERLGDARLFLGNLTFSNMVREYLDQPDAAATKLRLETWLANYRNSQRYERLLLDAQGGVRLASPAGQSGVSSVILRRIPEILRSDQIVVQDFYRDEYDDQRICLTLLVPVFSELSGHQPLGILALTIDTGIYLYPLIARWPAPSPSLETSIVRREGNDVVFLNDLRFQPHTALSLRFPVSRTDLPVVMAASGRTAIVDGWDHRGVPIIAAVRPVPDSPWFLMTRIDTAEAYAPMEQRLGLTFLLVAGLLVASATGVGTLWRQQQDRSSRQRVAAERERAWLQDVIARSLNEIYVFDPETLRFRFVNRGAWSNIGYSQEELAGLTPVDLKPAFTEETFRAMLQPLRTSERRVHVFETLHRRKDGSQYPVEVHLQLVDANTGSVFLAVVNDISDRKQAEAELRRAQRMESVGRLAGGFAHDFNNLLTVIRGSSELATLQLKPGSPLAGPLRDIQLASDKATALTRQLLTMSRKQAVQMVVLNLNEVIAEVETMLRSLIGGHLELAVVAAPDLGRVKADRSLIEQVLMNLTANARDAMPDHGVVTIETRNVELDEQHASGHLSTPPGSFVVLAVSDTGVGMDDATLARIFEPFFTTKGPKEGTGLGLATVYSIVQQCGGGIQVETAIGRGARFLIYLPRFEEAAPEVRS
jgi:PAS domain S-box-containing protein